MEIKTCEEYVLGELKAAQAKIEQLQDEKTRAIGELRSELIKVTSVKDYVAKVIDYLKGWITLVPKEGDKDSFELQAMGHIILNLQYPKELQQFIMLAPLFGDQVVQDKLKQMADATKEAAGSESEPGPEQADTKDTENQED